VDRGWFCGEGGLRCSVGCSVWARLAGVGKWGDFLCLTSAVTCGMGAGTLLWTRWLLIDGSCVSGKTSPTPALCERPVLQAAVCCRLLAAGVHLQCSTNALYHYAPLYTPCCAHVSKTLIRNTMHVPIFVHFHVHCVQPASVRERDLTQTQQQQSTPVDADSQPGQLLLQSRALLL
jgi:hypothetical protein